MEESDDSQDGAKEGVTEDNLRALKDIFPDYEEAVLEAALKLEAKNPKRALAAAVEYLTQAMEISPEGTPETSDEIVGEEIEPERKRDDSMDKMPGPSGIVKNARTGFLSTEEQSALEAVTQIFPSVDPHFVVERIAQHGDSLEELVERMTNDSAYPKWKDRVSREKVEQRRNDLLDPVQFNIDQLLSLFPDPEAYFRDETRVVSDNYRRHALAALGMDFPHMEQEQLTGALERHSQHYFPAHEDLLKKARLKKKKRKHFLGEEAGNEQWRNWPVEVDEAFFRELQFVRNQNDIREDVTRRANERAERVHAAQANRELVSCECCADEEVLPEEMQKCDNPTDKHQFCNSCVREHTKVQLGDGKHKIKCISIDCSHHFDLHTLHKLIDERMMGTLLSRSQQDELKKANMENMEECPFCNFAMIIENPLERLFRCHNPDCLRESCRKCKQLNHIPLKCEEVEKASETRMRKFVTDKMAEAIIRTCPSCGKRMMKSDGCNKMQCPCGTTYCYVCGEELRPQNAYDHFDKSGRFPFGRRGDEGSSTHKRCRLYTRMEEVHADVAERAGEEARQQYLEQHPDMGAESELKVDELVDRGEELSHARQRLNPHVVGLHQAFHRRIDIHFPRLYRAPSPDRFLHLAPHRYQHSQVQRKSAAKKMPSNRTEEREQRQKEIAKMRRNLRDESKTLWTGEEIKRREKERQRENEEMTRKAEERRREMHEMRRIRFEEMRRNSIEEMRRNYIDEVRQRKKERQRKFEDMRRSSVEEIGQNEEFLKIEEDVRRQIEAEKRRRCISQQPKVIISRVAEQLNQGPIHPNDVPESETGNGSNAHQTGQEPMEQSARSTSSGKTDEQTKDDVTPLITNTRALSVAAISTLSRKIKERKRISEENTSERHREGNGEPSSSQGKPKISHSEWEWNQEEVELKMQQADRRARLQLQPGEEIEITPSNEEQKTREGETDMVEVNREEVDPVVETPEELSHIAKLKKMRNALQEELGQVQLIVARERDHVKQRKDFQSLQALLKKRDLLERRIQEAEDSALRQGISEEQIRPEAVGLQLEDDEIFGAAEEAKTFAKEARNERKREAKAVLSSDKRLKRLDQQLVQRLDQQMIQRREKNQAWKWVMRNRMNDLRTILQSGIDDRHLTAIHFLLRDILSNDWDSIPHHRRQQYANRFRGHGEPALADMIQADRPLEEVMMQALDWFQRRCNEAVERQRNRAIEKDRERERRRQDVFSQTNFWSSDNPTVWGAHSNPFDRLYEPFEFLPTAYPDITQPSPFFTREPPELAQERHWTPFNENPNDNASTPPIPPSQPATVSNSLKEALKSEIEKKTNGKTRRASYDKKIENITDTEKPSPARKPEETRNDSRARKDVKRENQIQLQIVREEERVLEKRIEILRRGLNQNNNIEPLHRMREAIAVRLTGLETQERDLRQALLHLQTSRQEVEQEQERLVAQIDQARRDQNEEERHLAEATEQMQVIRNQIEFLERENRVPEEDTPGPSTAPIATGTVKVAQRESWETNIPEDLIAKIQEACASGKEKRIRRALERLGKEKPSDESAVIISLVSDDEEADEEPVAIPQESTAEVALAEEEQETAGRKEEEEVSRKLEGEAGRKVEGEGGRKDFAMQTMTEGDEVVKLSRSLSTTMPPPQQQPKKRTHSRSSSFEGFENSFFNLPLVKMRTSDQSPEIQKSPKREPQQYEERIVTGEVIRGQADQQRGVIQINIHLPEERRGRRDPDSDDTVEAPPEVEHMDFEEAI